MTNRRLWPGWRSTHRQSGMVTAELAVAIPSVVLVLSFLLGAVDLAIEQIRCVDAARAAARAAARGDSPGRVSELARLADPDLVSVSLSRGGGLVRVTVVGRAANLARVLPLPWRASASAVAASESSAPRGE